MFPKSGSIDSRPCITSGSPSGVFQNYFHSKVVHIFDNSVENRLMSLELARGLMFGRTVLFYSRIAWATNPCDFSNIER